MKSCFPQKRQETLVNKVNAGYEAADGSNVRSATAKINQRAVTKAVEKKEPALKKNDKPSKPKSAKTDKPNASVVKAEAGDRAKALPKPKAAAAAPKTKTAATGSAVKSGLAAKVASSPLEAPSSPGAKQPRATAKRAPEAKKPGATKPGGAARARKADVKGEAQEAPLSKAADLKTIKLVPKKKSAVKNKAEAKAPASEVLRSKKKKPLGRELAELVVAAASEHKALNPVLLDLSALSSVSDWFFIVSAENPRQMSAIAEKIIKRARDKGVRPLGHEGLGSGEKQWVLVDLGDVVVHIFNLEARELYDLEGLWTDAPRFSIEV